MDNKPRKFTSPPNLHTRVISPNELHNLQAYPKHKQLDNDIFNHILRHLKCILSQVNRQHDNIFSKHITAEQIYSYESLKKENPALPVNFMFYKHFNQHICVFSVLLCLLTFTVGKLVKVEVTFVKHTMKKVKRGAEKDEKGRDVWKPSLRKLQR